MERTEEHTPGDINSASGSLPGQQEAKETVFEDGQIRDTTGQVRPMKDGESYVYGDSRPDETTPSDTFVAIDDSPMMTTTRENLPEAHEPSEEFLKATSHGQDDEIRPHYDAKTDTEGQVIVHKENA